MLTIKAISEQLRSTTEPNEWTSELMNDQRSGVQKLVTSWLKRLEAQNKVKLEHEDKIQFDNSYKQTMSDLVAGIDEAGRGPLAGPVVTAAVIFKDYPSELFGINDSKQLSRSKRQHFAEIIKKHAHCYSIHIQAVDQIDTLNIYEATRLSMMRSVDSLSIEPQVLLVDAMKLPTATTQHSIIKGDAKSLAIAAASILAKTTRDELMDEFDKMYPEYHFAKNAGYGTALHIEALNKFGPTPIHRRSFEPIKSMIS
ncbi:ribonuclease HII [Paenisporosarcina sp. NPDC076898]|uniref:ribonuclease HII n=1 Tax=unclassified Paenisporosarcina TaxID=2642018 RepID=UPI003CFD42F7